MSPEPHSTKPPVPLSEATDAELRPVRGVCLDIDETVSTRGKLTAEAYGALWSLHDAGFAVVPITGRPAGWCDHIARFWPVNAVVGENGAFTFFMQDGVRRRLTTPLPNLTREQARNKLEALRAQIREVFPHAQWASDQAYREYDLAIDMCEDVEPWPAEQIDELMDLCRKAGGHVKLSSIHVNTWFGDYDKRAGFNAWLDAGAPGMSGGGVQGAAVPAPDEWLFIGDSPNDEPMFAAFDYTVGVANLRQYLDRLQTPPRWLTQAQSGRGFAEMAQRLVGLRRRS